MREGAIAFAIGLLLGLIFKIRRRMKADDDMADTAPHNRNGATQSRYGKSRYK